VRVVRVGVAGAGLWLHAVCPVAVLTVFHRAAATAEVVAGRVSDQWKDEDLPLDDEVLWPILDRVARGAITVRVDEYGYPWYRDGDRHCEFAGYLLEELTTQGYARWDSMIEGPEGRLIIRDDGIRAVKLEPKDHELLKRLSAEHVLDGERAACTASPTCGLAAVCGRCGWKTWPQRS
jgi:hypothetical protein